MVLFAADICKHFKTNIVGEKKEFKFLNKSGGEIQDNCFILFSLDTTLSVFIKIILFSFLSKLFFK